MKAGGYTMRGDPEQHPVSLFPRHTLIGFFFIGILSTAVDFAGLIFLTVYLGMWYLPSAALSYSSGTVISYLLNKHLNFRDKNRHYLSQFTTFAAISVSCLFVTLCVIWLCVEIFRLDYLTSKILAVICAFFWNYHGQSRLTFRNSEIIDDTSLRKM